MPENRVVTFSENDLYDNTAIEVVGGQAQLLQGVFIPNATSWATYSNDIDFNAGYGNLTGTSFGGASVIDGYLDLTFNDTRFVKYSAIANTNMTNKFAIQFKITFPFDDIPPSDNFIIDIESFPTNNNRFVLYQNSGNGNIILQVYDETGNAIVNSQFSYSCIADQEDQFLINVNIEDGQTEIYVNDAQIGSTQTATGNRQNTNDDLYIGATRGETETSNFKIRDLIFYNDVQPTSNEPYTLPEGPYSTFVPSIQSQLPINNVNVLDITENVVKPANTEVYYSFQDGTNTKWFDGNNVVLSSGYPEVNTADEINGFGHLFNFKNETLLNVFLQSTDGTETPIV